MGKTLQRAKIRNAIISLLKTQVALFEFEKTLFTDEKDIKMCDELINDAKKAQDIVMKIDHGDILVSIFNTYLGGKESYFAVLSKSIVKNVEHWDTEEGFKEFLELEAQAKQLYKQDLKEKEETRATIEKARAEGKQIEMVFENGKVKPIVVEEKKN